MRNSITRSLARVCVLAALALAGVFASTAFSSSAAGDGPERGKPKVSAAGKARLAAARPDLSTPRKIKRYLRSIGVNPRSVVIQRGHKNYAGPKCPGKAWTCTRARRVMQLGVQNTFECKPATSQSNTDPAFQECVIVQDVARKNVASCVQKSKHVPFVRQRCSITQAGKNNEATIVQVVDQTDGPIQGALQEAGVSQSATASKNQLQVDQEIKQTTTETTENGLIQDQDAYQVVSGPFEGSGLPVGPALQTAAAAGDNQSQINQKQTQRAKGGTTQTQNDGEFGVDAPFEEPVDCHVFALSPSQPNACARLLQISGSGHNQSQLSQTLDEEATATAVATQIQGSLRGGMDGGIHQETAEPGSSTNQANQSETQKLFAPPTSDQEQFGPGGCCGFGSQIGPGTEQINQQKLLEAKGGTEQTAILWGTSSSPDGSCAINHDVQTNSDQAAVSESAEPCPGLFVQTTCENAFVGEEEEEVVGDCQETEVVVCEPGEVPVPESEGPGIDCVTNGNGNGTTTGID